MSTVVTHSDRPLSAAAAVQIAAAHITITDIDARDLLALLAIPQLAKTVEFLWGEIDQHRKIIAAYAEADLAALAAEVPPC